MKAHVAHAHEKPHHPHWPLAVLLFSFVFGLGMNAVHDPGAWIRVKTGAAILSAHRLPRVDSFSYGAAGAPWTTHSWLADVLFAELDRLGGPRLLNVVKSASVAGGFALLLPISHGNPVLAAALLAVGACAAWPGMAESPAAFDLLLFALFLRLLRPRRRFRWIDAAAIAVLSALWSNLHGAGAVVALWFAWLKTFKASMRAAAGERMGYWAMLLAAVIVFSWNPHGYSVLSYSFADAAPGVAAWETPLVSLYGLLMLAGFVCCWLTLQQEFVTTLSAAAVMALSLILPGLRPLAALAACPVIALGLGHFIAPRPDDAPRVIGWSALAAALFAAYLQTVTRPAASAGGYSAPALAEAARWLDDNGVRGRMFNPPDIGAELIGLTDRPVFADRRRALYSAAFIAEAEDWPRRFQSLDAVFRFDYAVLRRRGKEETRIIDESRDWRRVYADDRALVYVKKSGVNARVAAR